MNKLSGHISGLSVSGALTQVTVSLYGGDTIRAIVIENPETASYLTDGHGIHVIFKETEVILGKGQQQLSLLNCITAKITDIKKGKLLSEIGLMTKAGRITAIISSEALELMLLKTDDEVTVMIKQNEVMLAE